MPEFDWTSTENPFRWILRTANQVRAQRFKRRMDREALLRTGK